jgi:hypothetical protein
MAGSFCKVPPHPPAFVRVSILEQIELPVDGATLGDKPYSAWVNSVSSTLSPVSTSISTINPMPGA